MDNQQVVSRLDTPTAVQIGGLMYGAIPATVFDELVALYGVAPCQHARSWEAELREAGYEVLPTVTAEALAIKAGGVRVDTAADIARHFDGVEFISVKPICAKAPPIIEIGSGRTACDQGA